MPPNVVLRAERVRARRGPQDDVLAARADVLSLAYLGGLAKPTHVSWVSNMTTRWGSCTPLDGTIRLSRDLEDMPRWVVDYVLLHELVHLLQPDHGPQFWALMRAYPKTERAIGYLQGYAAAQRRVVPVDVEDIEDIEDVAETEEGAVLADERGELPVGEARPAGITAAASA